MTVTTRWGATYRLEYRDLNGTGPRLAICRAEGADDPPATNRPMAPKRWYRVLTISPMPPQIGDRIKMVLESPGPQPDPITRRSSTIMSVVGTL